MRTVTFANDEVRDLLNERFVAYWNNHSSNYNNVGVQPSYTEPQIAAYPEGGGTGNVRAYVAAPDGRVLSELQGFWRAERFLPWLKFALELTPENAKARHLELAARIGRESAALKAEHPAEMRKRVRLSKTRQRVAALDLYAGWLGHSSGAAFGPVDSLLAQVRIESSLRVIA